MPSEREETREQHLQEILHAYLQAVDAGLAPSQDEVLRQHPDLADELRAFFADEGKLDRLAQATHSAGAVSPVSLTSMKTQSLAAGYSTTSASLGKVRYIGDYELLEEIARGGMGVVYKARQVSLNRLVALKMILAGELASGDQVARFRREAEAAASLDHPHIVPIYEVGEHEGRQYFSMKLVEGSSLAQDMRLFVSDHKAAAALLVTMVKAVHHSHQRGILHRDLKPGNILLERTPGSAVSPVPLVTDFGLAKWVNDEGGATHTGAIVGTPSYMAPEQASGKKGAVTTLADVYSLGAILYEMLTGSPPFRGETVLETLKQVQEKEVLPPSRRNPSVDHNLEAICLKCLEKDPQRRYSTAKELADDLENWLAGEPIQARPPSMALLLWTWLRKNTQAAVWIVVIGLVSGGLFSLSVGNAVSLDLFDLMAKSYARLPSEDVPRLLRIHSATAAWRGHPLVVIPSVLLGLALFLSIGLQVALVVKPKDRCSDAVAGISVGTVTGLTFFVLLGAPALLLNLGVFRQALDVSLLTEGCFPIPKHEHHGVDGLLTRYPDLRNLPPDEQSGCFQSKLMSDMIVGTFSGLWASMLLSFGLAIGSSLTQTLAAGPLVRGQFDALAASPRVMFFWTKWNLSLTLVHPTLGLIALLIMGIIDFEYIAILYRTPWGVKMLASTAVLMVAGVVIHLAAFGFMNKPVAHETEESMPRRSLSLVSIVWLIFFSAEFLVIFSVIFFGPTAIEVYEQF